MKIELLFIEHVCILYVYLGEDILHPRIHIEISCQNYHRGVYNEAYRQREAIMFW